MTKKSLINLCSFLVGVIGSDSFLFVWSPFGITHSAVLTAFLIVVPLAVAGMVCMSMTGKVALENFMLATGMFLLTAWRKIGSSLTKPLVDVYEFPSQANCADLIAAEREKQRKAREQTGQVYIDGMMLANALSMLHAARASTGIPELYLIGVPEQAPLQAYTPLLEDVPYSREREQEYAPCDGEKMLPVSEYTGAEYDPAWMTQRRK